MKDNQENKREWKEIERDMGKCLNEINCIVPKKKRAKKERKMKNILNLKHRPPFANYPHTLALACAKLNLNKKLCLYSSNKIKPTNPQKSPLLYVTTLWYLCATERFKY